MHEYDQGPTRPKAKGIISESVTPRTATLGSEAVRVLCVAKLSKLGVFDGKQGFAPKLHQDADAAN